MSYNSQILMSGTFHLDPSNASGGRRGPFPAVHPGIFQPPTSPSLSSSLQSELPTPLSNAKRKRMGARVSTPGHDFSGADGGYFGRDTIIDGRSDFDSRANGFGRRYVLAGQMDTPDGGTQKELGAMEDSIYSDVDYRRALGSARSQDYVESPMTTPMVVDTDHIPSGWGSYAFNTIGSVVGKVLEFCKIGAIRGFYAGGGTGYDLPNEPEHQQFWDNIPYESPPPSAFHTPYEYEVEAGTPESTPPPPPKRRQISYGTPTDELKNWVMIDEPANVGQKPSLVPRAQPHHPLQRPGAPLRRISKPVSRLNAPSYNRYPATQPSQASPIPIANREPASFAPFRSPAPSPIARAQTPSRIPVAAAASPAQSAFSASFIAKHPSRIASPGSHTKRSHRRSLSNVSTAPGSPIKLKKRESLLEMHDNAPRLDAKAKNLAAKRMKDEMETDLRINDFNTRLKDMIRQGREALGTTYEVDLADDDHGDPWESD